MKRNNLNDITGGAALLLLIACGQDAAPAKNAGTEETEIPTMGEATNRDWIPAGVVLPQPHTVLQDAKIGTRTYLLQVSVPNDPEGELAGWKSALETAGYSVNEAMLSDGRLLFDGADVESGQISVSQPEDVEGYMIQIDVSKNAQ